MTFTATLSEIIWLGAGRAKAIGTYVNDSGSTGGDIATGMGVVKAVTLQPTGSAVSADQPVYNETLPLGSTTAVTIVTSANESGSFEIYGRL